MVFTAELAGIPIEIRCRHGYNRYFLSDYMTEKAPVISAAPTEEDCLRIRRQLEQMAAREGRPPENYADWFLENNAIHALIAEQMPEYGVLLLHGSALCLDGEAFVFTASSGTGKSTQARLWRETYGDRVRMINDDKPLLRLEGGTVLVCGSPWDGKHHLSQNASAPLRAVLRVERSKENHLEPMSGADAFELLLRHCYIPEMPERKLRSMALITRISEMASFYSLHCNTDPEAVQVAGKGLGIL